MKKIEEWIACQKTVPEIVQKMNLQKKKNNQLKT